MRLTQESVASTKLWVVFPALYKHWAWGYMPVISGLGNWSHEDHKVKLLLTYRVSLRPLWAISQKIAKKKK